MEMITNIVYDANEWVDCFDNVVIIEEEESK